MITCINYFGNKKNCPPGKLSIKDFEEMLQMIKCKLTEKEQNAILYFLNPEH